MPVRTTLITSVSELSDFIVSWNRLAQTPFQRTEWYLSWWSSFSSKSRELRILLTIADEQLVGVTPLTIRNDLIWGRKLGFLGSGSACSDYQDSLTEPGFEPLVAHNVSETLLNGTMKGEWDVIELEGIAQQSKTTHLLIDELRSQNCIVQQSQLENTWRLGIDKGWECFMRNLAKTQQRQARNLLNRFEKSEELELEVVSSLQDFDLALEDLITLHQLRWNDAGKPGCFADKRFAEFLQLASHDLIQQGLVRFYFLRSEGRRIAGSIAFLDGQNNIFIYQTGRDPAKCDQRVGQTLNLLIIRHCCELGINFIDFLRGNEIYKERLRCEPLECSRIRCFADSIAARTRYRAWGIAKRIQRFASPAKVAANVDSTAETEVAVPLSNS